MVLIGTRTHGERRRRAIAVGDETFHKAEWMESGDDPGLSPTVFLVEQPPNTTLAPHFHRQNQFQLFVEGAGSIGRHPLRSLTVHYAGAYTGYGPLVAGESGIKYFTIRPVCESGFVPVAEAREKMIPGPKRHAQSAPFDERAPQDLGRLAAVEVEVAIPFADDGLGATVSSLPPGARLPGERAAAGDGQFLVVIAGSLRYGDIVLERWESMFVARDDEFPELLAGPGGAQVVAMHTPSKAAAYR
jgi:hypothetical protein